MVKRDPRVQVIKDTLAAWSDSHARHIEAQNAMIATSGFIGDMPVLHLDLTWKGGETQQDLRLIIKTGSN